MQHVYIDNRFTTEQVTRMQSASGPSNTFHNVITQEELEFLQQEIKKINYPETGKTSKYAGASYDDPQGKIIQQTLNGMGVENINEVRQGKYFEIDTKETDLKKAKDQVEEMCKKLLANLVIENYKIIDTQ